MQAATRRRLHNWLIKAWLALACLFAVNVVSWIVHAPEWFKNVVWFITGVVLVIWIGAAMIFNATAEDDDGGSDR
jgi:hypothetical protein